MHVNTTWSCSFSWALQGPCCVHLRHQVLHFWMSWCSRSRGYKRDILSTFMLELWLNSWHALTKLLLSRVNKLSRCWIYNSKLAKIAAHGHFMLRLSKNSYLDDSAHEPLVIPHTNFEMFDDSAHEFWRMIFSSSALANKIT